MKYTAINIGPILKTFRLARKPREMWSASYLFSYLMKKIIEHLPNKNDIISPATIDKIPSVTTDDGKPLGIGLYPDRLFVKGEIGYETIKPAIDEVAKTLNLDANYFNVMLTSDNCNGDADAIKKLNTKLDYMELFNVASEQTATEKVRDLIMNTYGSPLFVDALKDKEFPIDSLGEISAVWFKEIYPKEWSEFKGAIRNKDSKIAEKAFDKLPKKELKSYHKYICVVQADGDNMGAIVTHSRLPESMVQKISTELLKFGQNAAKKIIDFGGMPIYAGGDDLLFIAPVIGQNNKSILWLLDDINNDSFNEVKDMVDNIVVDGEKLKFEEGNNKDEEIHPSLSFGVSVSYYKYPLYEALESGRNLLFDKAKHIDGKNAIALDLRKHSGGKIGIELSGSKGNLKKVFNNMIEASTVDESIISAVAHKIRENEGLLRLWENASNDKKDMRNKNFFINYMEYDPNKKEKKASDNYKDAALKLLNELYKLPDMKANKLTQTLYGMLRTAKFIKGEEVRDE